MAVRLINEAWGLDNKGSCVGSKIDGLNKRNELRKIQSSLAAGRGVTAERKRPGIVGDE